MAKEYPIVDNVESFEAALASVRAAQKVYATYTQEQVDKIFKAAALAANNMRIPLAKMAVEETSMGVVEDKVIKNHYAAEYIYNAYKDTQTVGVLERDEAFGMMKVAEPIGVVAAVIPTTNPTSTAIFKTLICLKTRNGIIISPHPRAKKSTSWPWCVLTPGTLEASRQNTSALRNAVRHTAFRISTLLSALLHINIPVSTRRNLMFLREIIHIQRHGNIQ